MVETRRFSSTSLNKLAPSSATSAGMMERIVAENLFLAIVLVAAWTTSLYVTFSPE